MGGAVSAGEDNDNLVENLVNANYIRTSKLIEIFRAVDRGQYYVKGQRNSAYHDIAWKFNHLHLSAPCIYSEVMEHLDLKPGMSFLNLGSGTGYLSTMVGLVLGPNGINHGIEVHADVVDYAHDRLEEFISKSPAFDRFEFCRPQFQVGNCLLLPPDTPGYDRVYCGAACPPEYASYLMNLLNIGGKLVLPLEDQLQVKTRTGEQEWDSKSALAVSFAHLVLPNNANNNVKPTRAPERNVLPLQELCRFCIRRVIRDKFKVEMPPKKKRKKRERHQSVGTEEQVIARRRQIRLRRRRLNTTGESNTRRRRMNTSGDSDHVATSDSNDSSDDGDDSEMEADGGTDDEGETSDNETKDIRNDLDDSSTQNDLANDTNDITLSDPDHEKEEKTSSDPRTTQDRKRDFSKKSKDDTNDNSQGTSNATQNKAEGTSSPDESTQIADTSDPPRRRSRRYHFKFLRARPNNRSHQGQGDGPCSSVRINESDETSEKQQATQDEGCDPQERQLVPQLRPSRFAYALMRGLRRISDRRTPTTFRDMINAGESNSGRSEGEGEAADKLDGENSDSDDSDGTYKPLAETPFTISIRKLPLPASLINFLLYYRQ